VVSSLWLSWRARYAAFVVNFFPSIMVLSSFSWDSWMTCNRNNREASSTVAAPVSLFLSLFWTPTWKTS
jgi:hypothetical protein